MRYIDIRVLFSIGSLYKATQVFFVKKSETDLHESGGEVKWAV